VKSTLLTAVYDQREALLRRVALLDDTDWDLPCAVAGPAATRPVREIVAHLLLADALILSGAVGARWQRTGRLQMPGSWDPAPLRAMAQLPVSALVTLLAQRGEKVARLIARAPLASWRLPVAGPAGRRPAAQLWADRVVHEWLHEHDIAGCSADQAPVAMRPATVSLATDAVLRTVADAVLPTVSLDHGVVRLVVRGDASSRTWGVDFARRRYGPRVTAAPDAQLRLTPQDLVLIVNGRGDRVPNSIDVTGDPDLAGRLLEALAAPAATASSLCRDVHAVG